MAESARMKAMEARLKDLETEVTEIKKELKDINSLLAETNRQVQWPMQNFPNSSKDKEENSRSAEAKAQASKSTTETTDEEVDEIDSEARRPCEDLLQVAGRPEKVGESDKSLGDSGNLDEPLKIIDEDDTLMKFAEDYNVSVSPAKKFTEDYNVSVTPAKIDGKLFVFSYRQINVTTNSFSPSKEKTRGRNRVYEGYINVKLGRNSENVRVDIQKLEPKVEERVKIEMIEPVQKWLADVQYLGHLSHPNMQHLYGYCCENKQCFLLHESSDSGTLDRHLFPATEAKPEITCIRRLTSTSSAVKEATPKFTWHRRMTIALDIAEGLAYLHSRERPLTYYKPIFAANNIFLDQNLNVKLCDFGIAKEGDEKNGPREDIYGFGLVMLEILTGQKAIDMNRCREEQFKAFRRGDMIHEKYLTRLDSNMHGEYTKKMGMMALKVAHECLNPIPRERPGDMAVVVEWLKDVLKEEKEEEDRQKDEQAGIRMRMIEHSMQDMSCLEFKW